jgi:hypothetical protein
LTALDGAWPLDGTGLVAVTAATDDGRAEGAAFRLSPAAGDVVYTAGGAPDMDVAATSADGVGVFVDVEPGTYTETVRYPSLDCTARTWAGPAGCCRW